MRNRNRWILGTYSCLTRQINCVITIGTQAYNLLLIRTMIAYVVYGKNVCVE